MTGRGDYIQPSVHSSKHTAVIKGDTWREVGDRIMAGKEPVRFFEMNLKRVGDTNWPAAGAVSPK